MVRSESHLDRIMAEVEASPGMILFTLVSGELRARLERRASAQGLPTVPALDAVTDALSRILVQEAKPRTGRLLVPAAPSFRSLARIHISVPKHDTPLPVNRH